MSRTWLFATITLILASILAFGLAEFAARFLYAETNMGWIHERPLPDRLARCADTNKAIAVFGDSYVEYFRGSRRNTVEIADTRLADFSLCNFGVSGHFLDDYVVSWEYASRQLAFSGAVFVLFAGNDFDPYFLHATQMRRQEQTVSTNPVTEPFDLPLTAMPYLTPRQGALWNLAKRSVFLNAMYRLVIKRHFTPLPMKAETIEQRLGSMIATLDVPPLVIAPRLAEVPPSIVQEMGMGMINHSLLDRALIDPGYFRRLQRGFGTLGPSVEAQARNRLDRILAVCTAAGIPCGFVFIEADPFISPVNHAFYEAIGFELADVELGPTPLSKRLIAHLRERDVVAVNSFAALEGNPELFIARDGHLTHDGHAVFADLLVGVVEEMMQSKGSPAQ